MEAWLEFARGPLFRVCFALMILGLLRVLVLTAINMVEAFRRNPDKILPWKDLTLKTIGWLFPFGKLWTKRPVYSTFSFLFHIGLILVPLFLYAHAQLWKRAIGYSWPALPQSVANWLTLLMLVCAAGLLVGRLVDRGALTISRRQEFMWLILLSVPFATGYLCSNADLAPKTYQALLLVHILAADLVMVMIPFTKIAHCILLPLAQYVTGIAWKLPCGAGERVAATLGYPDRPTWVERPRVSTREAGSPMEEA